MAKAGFLARILRGAKGTAKTGVTAGVASAVTRAFSKSEEATDDLNATAQTAGDAIAVSTERPIQKPDVSGTEVSDATLAFTKYVITQTERAEPIRALGPRLPELTISKKYSPIMKDIIENINGIKKRLDRVEIKTRKQTQILLNLKTASMGLNQVVRDDLDEKRRDELKEKREADEEQVERKGIGDYGRDAFRKIGEFGGRLKDGILAALSPFLLPAALFGTSFALEQAQQFIPEDLELEQVLKVVDTVEEKVAGIAAAFMGLARGSAIGQGVQNISRAIRSFTGAQGMAAAQQVVSKVRPGNPAYAKFLPALQRAQGFFARISRMTGSITAAAAQWGARLGSSFTKLLGNIGKKVIRWYLIFEAFKIMMNAAQLLIMGTIDESEFHKRTKEQIGEIVRILGAPYLLMVLFGLLGTPVPILGNAAGAVAGFLAGIFLGDAVFESLGMQQLVDGLYDWLFLGDFSKLRTYPPVLLRGLAFALPRAIAAEVSEQYERVTRFADSLLQDTMATEEEIVSKYGEGAGDLDILRQATEGRGTDENAVLYAFRNIKSVSDYNAFKNRFETEFLPEYNRDRLFGKVDTMEEYLKKELLTDEYKQLVEQINSQIMETGNIEQERLNNFLREMTGVSVLPRITGFRGEHSQEEFNMWKAGMITPVTLKDSSQVLMTEEQIRTSDEIGIAARKGALRRINQAQTSAAAQGITYTPMQNEEANVIPAPPAENKPNIVVIDGTKQPTLQVEQLAGTEGPAPYTSATPTRAVDDPFIDISYAT